MTLVQRGLWGGRRRDVPAYRQQLSGKERAVVEDFVDSLGTLSNIRKDKYRTYVSKIGVEIGTPFVAITRRQLPDYLAEVQESGYSEDTKRDIRQVAKRFFRWLHDEDFVRGIRLGTVEGVIGPEDILTDLELDNLRGAARDSLRNSALAEASS